MQDIIGTGLYSGEYFVASKSINKKINATLGLGWGRYASNNKSSKGPNFDGAIVQLSLNQLYKGDIGIFGGFEYNTPIDGMSVKVEILQMIIQMIWLILQHYHITIFLIMALIIN